MIQLIIKLVRLLAYLLKKGLSSCKEKSDRSGHKLRSKRLGKIINLLAIIDTALDVLDGEDNAIDFIIDNDIIDHSTSSSENESFKY